MANTLKFGNGEWYGKKDTILAYNDENNNYKPLPFDFSRGSSATVVNKDGLIETVGSGQPRIDYKDNTKGALLLEPSRSNLVTYSEDFSNGVWNIGGATTIILDNLLSPDGEHSSYKQVENNTINSFSTRYSSSISYISGLKYITSIFAKSDNRNLMIRSYNGSSDIDTIFDLSNGTILSGSTGEIKDYGNGWYRCSHTITAQSTINTVYAASFVLVNGSSYSYQGDGTSGVYIYGAQLEQGSYATSYIPTSGGVVTRIVDICNNGGNEQVFNDSEGVLYAEVSAFIGAGGGTRRIELSNGLNPSQYVRLQITNGDGSLYSIVNNGTEQFLFNYTSFNATQNNKIAIKYKENDFALWVNGIEVGSSNIGNTFANGVLTQANLSPTSFYFYGKTKELQVFTTALSDQELQALTTI